jgi:hypothetical protein
MALENVRTVSPNRDRQTAYQKAEFGTDVVMVS